MISIIEDKILTMYAQGISKYEIADNFKKDYGITLSNKLISNIIDTIQPNLQQWQTKPLASCYPFIFIDCLPIKINDANSKSSFHLYTILAYDLKGDKDILGIWLNSLEEKLTIFDELKQRGVQDVFFVVINDDIGLETAVKEAFKDAIIHDNIIQQLKKVASFLIDQDDDFINLLYEMHTAINQTTALALHEQILSKYTHYPQVLAILNNNQRHLIDLLAYKARIRALIFDSSDINLIHDRFEEIVARQEFSEAEELIKILYLAILNLNEQIATVAREKWIAILSYLLEQAQFKKRVSKYLN